MENSAGVREGTLVASGQTGACGRGLRLAAIVALALIAACGPAREYHRIAGETMGTEYAVTLSGGSACTAEVSNQIEMELRAVNAQMSTWRPDSEISRFNAAPAGKWMPVSAELAGLVALAQELARESGGAFDVTVSPLVDLWGFGVRARSGLPAAEEIADAATRVGFRYLEARPSPPALRKERAGLEVDLSAIAKGHGVDRLAALLDGRGCTDYLVEIGGEVRVRGMNPLGAAWRIAVDVPGSSAGPVLRLTEGALATSGDYRNFRTVGDTRYSHTIDPRTGRPVAHEMMSVTVMADTAALADGLATLINVLGPADGLAFARRRGIAALALVRHEGKLDRRYTEAMRDHIDRLR